MVKTALDRMKASTTVNELLPILPSSDEFDDDDDMQLSRLQFNCLRVPCRGWSKRRNWTTFDRRRLYAAGVKRESDWVRRRRGKTSRTTCTLAACKTTCFVFTATDNEKRNWLHIIRKTITFSIKTVRYTGFWSMVLKQLCAIYFEMLYIKKKF